MQALSTDSPTSAVVKVARALRKPSGAIAVALEFFRPKELGAGIPVRAKDSKDRLQIAGQRGLSATIRKEKAAAIIVTVDTGAGYSLEALAAFVTEQVRGSIRILSSHSNMGETWARNLKQMVCLAL